jgi:hypothetical protein
MVRIVYSLHGKTMLKFKKVREVEKVRQVVEQIWIGNQT